MNHPDRGLDEVRVNREQLLKALRANRDNHRTKFEEAMEGYKQKSIELLEEHIERIRTAAPEKVTVSLPFPEDHTDDYDRIIKQMEWSLDDELVITDRDFEMYVLDQWHWKAAFAATAAMYAQ